jgi:hypothetical protein
MGEERKMYEVLVGKPEGKRPLGRPRRRWEKGIRMDLKEISLGGGCGLNSAGPKRDEVTGEWRKLHSEELHILYSSPNIIRQIKSRRMRWAGHVARMGEQRKLYKVLVGNPEGKRPLGRPRRRWEDGIRIDLREIGLGGVYWIRLAQDRDRWRAVVSAVMNLRVLAPRS